MAKVKGERLDEQRVEKKRVGQYKIRERLEEKKRVRIEGQTDGTERSKMISNAED